jgi:alpha-mannosidase
MIDTLLVTAGETQRRFRFTIAVDAAYPLEAAWNATAPVPVIATSQGPPRSGQTCWFFHLDGRHVQVLRLLETHDSSPPTSSLEQFEHSTVPPDPGFALRLMETEGRSKPVRLRCFQRPTFARKRDFRGDTIAVLPIEGDSVVIDIAAYEVSDVELRFGQS